jgi:CDGSH-type Zn-finger protein
MGLVVIQTLRNGPLLVKGPVEFQDAAGKRIMAAGGETVALCRCGHSSTKPFCDGSHKKADFKDQAGTPE